MHTPIAGYRELSSEELELINEIKAHAEVVGQLVEKVHAFDTDIDSGKKIDHRWANEARTDLQKGFMSLVRAVAQPSTF